MQSLLAFSEIRINHSLCDDTYLISLVSSTRQTSDTDKVPTIHGNKKRVIHSSVNNMATIMFPEDTTTPIKGRPCSVFNPGRIVYRTVSLDDMKLVKNASITDVALGVTHAGLSIHPNRRYGEGEKARGVTEKNNNLPKNIIHR
uniref:Uncharacterized protein n=1 Tax=Solanum lycopersicum TaxID=4081 RepID=K4ATY4_SOLLC